MPVYHFTGPNAGSTIPPVSFYHKGAYHLFYQYDPIVNGKYSKRCWGMWSAKISSTGITDLSRYGPARNKTAAVYIRKHSYSYTGNASGHEETYRMPARSHDEFLT